MKVGDNLKLLRKGRIRHRFEIGKIYQVIRFHGNTVDVSNGRFEQTIETECFEPAFLEEIIYLEEVNDVKPSDS
jgi:hypothetical protein